MTADLAGSYGTVIVGAGHAGTQAAASLIAAGYDDGVAVLSDEPMLPYDRPSLSKGYLTGDSQYDDILLRTEDFWRAPGIGLIATAAVVAIDPSEHIVELADGRRYQYASLIWAAGGSARRLQIPGAELAGIHTVRGFADVERLRDESRRAASAVIIGGGYIGLESAASLRSIGVDVTVVEVADRLLARVAGPTVAEHFLQRHRAAGAQVRTQASAIEFCGDEGRVRSVLLGTGDMLKADIVIVGVGLVPNVVPLVAAGADVSNGLDVDEHCRTSIPDVYAIGDCVNFPIPLYGRRRVRLESVQNAVDQARVAAGAILGEERTYDPVPWFWSHQYDVRFQTVGILTGYDDEVVRCDPERGSFSVVYLKDSVILAVDAVNAPKDFAQAKAIVGRAFHGSRAELADSTRSLKEVATVLRSSTAN
jgi:3-phenylpropionate/trans-cinnamate dioxygenase ferredoxin reductase subunit